MSKAKDIFSAEALSLLPHKQTEAVRFTFLVFFGLTENAKGNTSQQGSLGRLEALEEAEICWPGLPAQGGRGCESVSREQTSGKVLCWTFCPWPRRLDRVGLKRLYPGFLASVSRAYC